jgi:hypothetical protein
MNLKPKSLIVESTYFQAQQSLEEVLGMGLTFDDLVAEGMHPVFLKQLFARLNPYSPHPVATTTPQPIDTPEPVHDQQRSPQTATIAEKSDFTSDVENFLETLEPTMSSPANGNDDSKKRTLSSDSVSHPPKRRAFGLVPPRELVIDVSDDDEDDDEDETAVKKPAPLPKPQSRPLAKISKRPPLKKKVLFVGIVLTYRTLSKPYDTANCKSRL